MDKFDNGYYFAPYMPIGYVPGAYCLKYGNTEVDKPYYENYNDNYNKKER